MHTLERICLVSIITAYLLFLCSLAISSYRAGRGRINVEEAVVPKGEEPDKLILTDITPKPGSCVGYSSNYFFHRWLPCETDPNDALGLWLCRYGFNLAGEMDHKSVFYVYQEGGYRYSTGKFLWYNPIEREWGPEDDPSMVPSLPPIPPKSDPHTAMMPKVGSK